MMEEINLSRVLHREVFVGDSGAFHASRWCLVGNRRPHDADTEKMTVRKARKRGYGPCTTCINQLFEDDER